VVKKGKGRQGAKAGHWDAPVAPAPSASKAGLVALRRWWITVDKLEAPGPTAPVPAGEGRAAAQPGGARGSGAMAAHHSAGLPSTETG